MVGEATTKVGLTLGVELHPKDFERSERGACSDVKRTSLKRFAWGTDFQTTAAAQDAQERCERRCLGERECWGCSMYCEATAYGSGSYGTNCAWHAVSACAHAHGE